MFWIFANDSDCAFPSDDFAFLTDRLNWCSNLHDNLSFPKRSANIISLFYIKSKYENTENAHKYAIIQVKSYKTFKPIYLSR